MSTISAVEQVKKLKLQVQELQSQAHEEIMAKITSALAELKDLGFDYELTVTGKPAKSTAGTKKPDVIKPCEFCTYMGKPMYGKSDLNHSSKAHNRQQKDKKKFPELAKWIKDGKPHEK
jgi:hypothetical protein